MFVNSILQRYLLLFNAKYDYHVNNSMLRHGNISSVNTSSQNQIYELPFYFIGSKKVHFLNIVKQNTTDMHLELINTCKY